MQCVLMYIESVTHIPAAAAKMPDIIRPMATADL